VFGTIAGVNNGTGVVGVNPNKQLKLHIVKVFGNAGAWTYSSTLASAANKCGAAGANVITMSLGGGAKSITEQRAFDSLQSKGVLSIAAAGNDGNTTTSYPAGYSQRDVGGAGRREQGLGHLLAVQQQGRDRRSGRQRAVDRPDGHRPGSGPDGRREHLRAGRNGRFAGQDRDRPAGRLRHRRHRQHRRLRQGLPDPARHRRLRDQGQRTARTAAASARSCTTTWQAPSAARWAPP
jgi:subtilisin family serine protease